MMNNIKCKAEVHNDCNGRVQYNIPCDAATAKNMGLCLEVEMDEEVREIIRSPENHPSALLDVTVIKPKGLECFYEKKTLHTEDVRKLIASMEIEQQGKKDLLEKIFVDKNKKKHQQQNCFQDDNIYNFDQGDFNCTTDERESRIFYKKDKQQSNKKQRIGDHEGVKQVFTTPKTYSNIRSIFQCKNKYDHEENRKPNKPCTCQNCAIVGILTDSQKNPFADEITYDARDTCNKMPRRKKSVTFKQDAQEDHEECQYYFRQLSARIRELEHRIAIQEDRAVPKDYFKRIISKLVNHITKLTHYSTDVNKAIHSDKCREREPQYGFKSSTKYDKYDSKYDSYSKKHNKYYVNPILIHERNTRIPAERDLDESASDINQKHNLWKWGSEILKPGIDLKNKIVFLLEDTLNSLKRSWEKPKTDKTEEELKKFVEELSKNLYRTLNENKTDTHDSYELEKELRKREKKRAKEEKCCHKRHLLPRFTLTKECLEENKVNVKYVNPKLSTWNEESTVSFKVGSVDFVPETSSSKQYKQEFLKALQGTKTSDKLTLWKTIWNQAQANGQSMKDKVTIQIPFSVDSRNKKMVEIQYTLAEIRHLLGGEKEDT